MFKKDEVLQVEKSSGKVVEAGMKLEHGSRRGSRLILSIIFGNF